jgi:hypothetical protein
MPVTTLVKAKDVATHGTFGTVHGLGSSESGNPEVHLLSTFSPVFLICFIMHVFCHNFCNIFTSPCKDMVSQDVLLIEMACFPKVHMKVLIVLDI